MSYNNKSIATGILIKTKTGLGNIGYFGNYTKIDNLEDYFCILTEIETDYNDRVHDILVFYGLTEERFFRRYRWFIERSIRDGIINIVD